jgi:hypothetical protein
MRGRDLASTIQEGEGKDLGFIIRMKRAYK